MARLLLDTTVLIGWFRGTEATRAWIARTIPGDDIVGLCPINVAEVFTRAHPHELPRWQDLLMALHHWEVTLEDGASAGRTRYELARSGIQAGMQDALIAAVASRVGATVVTTNVRDFERLGVPVLNPAPG